MTSETKTWTPWLTNPGDGVCPVPEWAEDAGIRLRDGSETTDGAVPKALFWQDDGGNWNITHYRYAVPEDLAWLARQVSEWPDACGYIMRGEGDVAHGHFRDAEQPWEYTKNQWIRTRQDLGLESPEGKPSWDDAPEWAEWLCQNSDGEWFFYSHEPKPTDDGVWEITGKPDAVFPLGYELAGKTPVHGDWRNTLERRPLPVIPPEEGDGALVPRPFLKLAVEKHESELRRILKKARVEKARKRLAPIAGGVKMTEKQHTSDGSTASYYELPDGATELQHLISHRDMNAQIGEVFRACYRYGQASHSDRLRDAKKIRFYADAEIERLEKLK